MAKELRERDIERHLVKRVKELGMDAVAVTDHGNLHAAREFYEAAKGTGVKPGSPPTW